MPDTRRHAPLAGILLCLCVLGGCEQPQTPGGVVDPQAFPEPAPRQELPAALPPDIAITETAVPEASPAETPVPAAALPENSAATVETAGKAPAPGALVLIPEYTPFAEEPAHGFGEVRNADWLAAPSRQSPQVRLLPDLFEANPVQDRVNVEGELMLDGSQRTSRMLEGVGMKLKISTD